MFRKACIKTRMYLIIYNLFDKYLVMMKCDIFIYQMQFFICYTIHENAYSIIFSERIQMKTYIMCFVISGYIY